MTEQDRAFLDRIKQHLRKKGDFVKVSDIHPGEWSKVCFTAAGARDDAIWTVAEFEKIDRGQVEVINRPKNQASHGDMFDWGIYFFYPPNKIEYFRLFNGYAFPSQLKAKTDDYRCVIRRDAYFFATTDMTKEDYTNEYLSIQLTEYEKEKK